MILSRTPLRISLFGGGTDLPEFYTQHTGAVVSFTIDKYIHVGVNEKFDGKTRVSYSRTEIVEDPAELEHDLVRETLKHFHLKGLEITSISDIPGEGSGLGSSSAFTVGLIKALSALSGGNLNAPASVFAQEAYAVERNLCGHPVGKQDHYAAAYGGLNYFQFNPDGTVNAEPIFITDNIKTFIESCVMLFWTGKTRKAEGILLNQANRFRSDKSAVASASTMANQAILARRLLEEENFTQLGMMMDMAWYAKKQLATVTNEEIDLVYSRAKLAGAQGGKICGAGGGGFLMLIAEPPDQGPIEKAVGLQRVPFQMEECGSKIVYKG